MAHLPRSPRPLRDGERVDALVVGAGFGGLGAALALAEQGARVAVCEALAYPGGCASTFTRQGYRFETGATLFSGFGEGQLMQRLIARHGLPVRVQALDPVVELRTPTASLPVDADREAFVERLCRLPGAPAPAIRRFFAWQRGHADHLWSLLDDETLLPPLSPWAALRHVGGATALLPVLGRPLAAVLRRFGLYDFAPLRTWLEAVCQITVQCGVDEVESAFALGSMDYFWRGTGHVHGGIGELAHALCAAVERSGGQVHLAHRVRSLRREGDGWTADVRGRRVHARVVLANLLPQAVQDLAGEQTAQTRRLGDRLAAEGWGACMLYLGLDGASSPLPHHLQLVADPEQPLQDGNHLFCSVSGADEARGPDGARAVTVSTHVSVAALQALPAEAQAQRVHEIQDRMRETLARLAPELWQQRVLELPASPRTWQRFTRRPQGLVGGLPRRAGLAWLRDLGPIQVAPGLYLVGDTAFPGQSTLAATLGGRRAAAAALRGGLRLEAQPGGDGRAAQARAG